MADDFESYKIRVEFLEKEFRKIIGQVDASLTFPYIQNKIELYFYIARAIKAEAESDLLKTFLVDSGMINYQKYVDYRKNSELLKTYVDENEMILELSNYFKKLELDPSNHQNIVDFVSCSNLVIQKRRLKIKRERLIKQGFAENSEFVKEIDAGLIETETVLTQALSMKNKPVEEQEYYVKKELAEKIFGDLVKDRDSIVERARHLPLPGGFHMEAQSSALYAETLRNYWIGNFNAAIVMLAIFVESFLKEIYLFKEGKHSEETLTPLVEICRTNGYLTDPERDALKIFSETTRNDYLHSKLQNIIKKSVVPAFKFDTKETKNNPQETYLTEKELPGIRALLKPDIDRVKSRKMILDIVKIISAISNRIYVNPPVEEKITPKE